MLTAKATSGAAVGTTDITVLDLARGAIATSANGKGSATATVAAGTGSFVFKVGSGDNQTVAIDATTTLQGLANAINGKDAGVSASVVTRPCFRPRGSMATMSGASCDDGKAFRARCVRPLQISP